MVKVIIVQVEISLDNLEDSKKEYIFYMEIVMKNLVKQLQLGLIVMVFATSQCFADWESEKDPMGGDFYRVTNTETGQTINKTYGSKKKADKAAKILNKADKSVMLGPDGQGDYRPGGNFPR